MLKGLISDLEIAILKAAVFGPLFGTGKGGNNGLLGGALNSLTNSFSGLFSGLFGGAGAAGAAGAGAASAGGGILDGLSEIGALFLASGGPVSPGGAYVVGEQGPELFKPSSAGTIIPNSALGGSSGGGGGDSYTYNIDARGAQQGVAPQIMAAIQASENRAVSRSVKRVRDLSLRTA